MIVQISAEQGPAECRLAVAKLFEALKREHEDLDDQCGRLCGWKEMA